MRSKAEVEKTIVKLYKSGLSMGEITKKVSSKFKEEKWYPMKIQRVLKKAAANGLVEIRTSSEAQKLALQEGRSKHPTEGKKRSEDVKRKISYGMDRYFSNLSEEEAKQILMSRAENVKIRWENMTDEERVNALNKMKEGQRKLVSEGTSKIEKDIMTELKNRGYHPISKYKYNTQASEIDIYIDNTHAVEIDGPTHFLPIYGEETLKKTLTKDKKKDKILLGAGISLMRVQVHRGGSKILVYKIVNEIEKWMKKSGKKVKIINTKDL